MPVALGVVRRRRHQRGGGGYSVAGIWVLLLVVLVVVVLLPIVYLNAVYYYGAAHWPSTTTATTTRPYHHPPPRTVPPFIQTVSGPNWKLWDPLVDGVLFPNYQHSTCDWTLFRPATPDRLPAMVPWSVPPTTTTHTPVVPMCVYLNQRDEWVSGSIRRHGRWDECDVLSSLVYQNGNELYVDVGANIGACLLQVLLTTNATIVAFEPSPLNLFMLTSTLLALPNDKLRDRVWLFPIGLAETQSSQSLIYTARDNPGHSIVGGPVRTNRDEYLSPMPIVLERLDAVLDATHIASRDLHARRGGISAFKLDAEGYECSVLRSMTLTLWAPLIHVIKFENEPTLLAAASVSSSHPCSSSLLFDLLTKPMNKGGADFMIRALYQDPTSIGDQFDAYSEDVQDMLGMPLNYSIIEVEWR